MGCYPPLAKIVSRALGKCNGGACQVLRFHFFTSSASLLNSFFWLVALVLLDSSRGCAVVLRAEACMHGARLLCHRSPHHRKL